MTERGARGTPSWGSRLAIVVLVALLLRVVAVIVATQLGYSPVRGDAITYDGLAQSLAAGHGYLHENRTDNVRPPLWPFVLSLVYRAAGHAPLAGAFLQTALDSASVAALAVLALLLTGSAVTALVAAGLFALWPGAIFMNVVLYTEPLYTLLVILAMTALARMELSPTLRRGVITGLAFGALGLTRQTTLYFLPVYAVVAPLVAGGGRPRWIARAAALLVCVAVLAPWTIRDQVKHGQVTWLQDYSGLNLWIGNHLPYEGRAIDREALHRIYDRLGDDVADMGVVNRELAREAIASMRAHPAETAWLWVQKAWRFLFVDMRPSHLWIRIGLSVALLAAYGLAWYGALALPPATTPAVRAIATFMGYFMLVHVVTYSQMRFAEPVRPLVLALTAHGLVRAWNARRTAPAA